MMTLMNFTKKTPMIDGFAASLDKNMEINYLISVRERLQSK